MSKIGSVVINCKDFDKTCKFWQETLHYVRGTSQSSLAAAEGDFVILKDPSGH